MHSHNTIYKTSGDFDTVLGGGWSGSRGFTHQFPGVLTSVTGVSRISSPWKLTHAPAGTVPHVYTNSQTRTYVLPVFTIRVTLLMLTLFLACSGAWAQNAEGRFAEYYTETYHYWTGSLYSISGMSVQHRKAKWYEFRNQDDYRDTFDGESGGMVYTLDGLTEIQAAHTYIDTLYVHKGTTISLPLPYRNPLTYNWSANADVSVAHYQRWFDYRTDGNYYCNYTPDDRSYTIYDLLTQTDDIWTYPYNQDNTNYSYRYVNGYVQIGCTRGTASALSEMVFYYPTDDEYEAYAESHLQNEGYTKSLNGGRNDYYVIACDVGNYNDTDTGYKWDGNAFGTASVDNYSTVGNYWYEPTLEGRSVFYVVGLEYDETDGKMPEGFEDYYKLTEAKYQGTGDSYLEEYEITFPSRHLSNKTDELVALSKSAKAYAIPGVDATDDSDGLTVTITSDEGAGFTLKTTALSGDSRVIQFNKGSSGSPWTVADGTKATILVTKDVTVDGVTTSYHIARYKLTFRDSATPLTQTQVAGLGTYANGEDYWWKDMTYRSPDYIDGSYDLLNSLTFTYPGVEDASGIFTNGNAGYYPFPLDWESSSYAFYDGSALKGGSGDFEGSGGTGAGYCTYALVSDYLGDDDKTNSNRPPRNTGKDDEDGDYWIYVDASDSPGSVAELAFTEDLCVGSEIIGTMWVKGASNSGSDDAAVLLTFMGVNYEYDTQGNVIGETREPIYRQCSSQIRTTTYLSGQPDEDGLDSDVTGKGSGTNQWFQLYFSFVNKSEVVYDHYSLKIDNYCASTAGGDYYIDEIKLYIMRPEVGMAQLEPMCTTDGEMSLMRLSLNYETIMSRLGYEVEDPASYGETTAAVDLVIINKSKYYNYLADVETPAMTDSVAAFEASMVTFYDTGGSGDSGTGWQMPEFTFYPNYGVNPEYGDEGPAVFDGNGVGYLYRRLNDGNEEELSVDCSTDMMAYTPYIVILQPHTDWSTEEAEVEYFVTLLDDECAIRTEFYLTAATILKINGEMVDPETDYCAGQEIVIAPEMTYTAAEEGEEETFYLDGIYFDWFFGSVEEYTQANTEFNGVSLYEALVAFRNEYPDAEELSKTATPPTGDGATDFTEYHYGIIEYYLGQTRRGGHNNMLVLHTTHLDVRVLSTGITLVIQPIHVEIADPETGEPITTVCFGYVPLALVSSGDAPTVQAGFSNISYPDGDITPCLRMGLAQIGKCTAETPLTVNLCNATYVDEEYNGVIHLGKVTGLEELFLVDTDDPAYDEEMQDSSFTQFSLPVGRIQRFYANVDPAENDPDTDAPTDESGNGIGSYMQLYFFTDEGTAEAETGKVFSAREGYYYVVNVFFEEQNADGEYVGDESDVAMCQGSMPLEIKVVPEYLVWTGDGTSNWNNDGNWKRADRSEIHKTAVEEGDEYPTDDPYPTNATNGTDNGFVPMLFTKVIMPRDSEAELYMAGFIADGTVQGEGTTPMLSWQGDDVATTDGGDDDDDDDDETTPVDVPGHPTPYIMYDLMVYENATENTLTTEHYRVNLCDGIQFEPGAQLLHSEQLIYSKAWTDVEIAQGPWTLAATPLNGVFSGDWYTKKATGTETAEYFTDIYFDEEDENNNALNDRLNPMVYQRNWSNSGNTIVYTQETTDSKTVPAYISTGWSSVYNDVTIPHQAGEGFSIKASRTISSTTGEADNKDNLMFRFPKADVSYTYQNGSETATPTDGIDRTNAGRLLISDLVVRTDPDKDAPKDETNNGVYTGEKITVELTQTDNDYYIVGNPFTAAMSMRKFMEQNEGVKAYWSDSPNGPIFGGNNSPTSDDYDDYLLPPYTGFFITFGESDTEPYSTQPITICFTEDMQELTTDFGYTGFYIGATNGQGGSKAYVAYNGSASDAYLLGEDVPLLEDISWTRDGLPMVYTVAGDMAVSINSLKELELIPVGVFADEGSVYTLSFAGVNKIENPILIDTYEDTETPITEGLTLEMEGPSHGRYFIRTQGMATDMDDIEEIAGEVNAVSVYSPVQRTVVVSSDAGLESVEIYTVGGMLLKRVNAGGSLSCTIGGVASSIAIVRVRTAEGTTVRKIRVR